MALVAAALWAKETTWTGGGVDANWANAANWSNGAAADGDQIDCSDANEVFCAVGILNIPSPAEYLLILTHGVHVVTAGLHDAGCTLPGVQIGHADADVQVTGDCGYLYITAGALRISGAITSGSLTSMGGSVELAAAATITTPVELGAITGQPTLRIPGVVPWVGDVSLGGYCAPVLSIASETFPGGPWVCVTRIDGTVELDGSSALVLSTSHNVEWEAGTTQLVGPGRVRGAPVRDATASAGVAFEESAPPVGVTAGLGGYAVDQGATNTGTGTGT